MIDGHPKFLVMSNPLVRFRQQYPQGSLRTDLLQVDRGLYVVQTVVTLAGQAIATGLAAQPTIEGAEDLARERALTILGLTEGRPPSPEQPIVSAPTSAPPPAKSPSLLAVTPSTETPKASTATSQSITPPPVATPAPLNESSESTVDELPLPINQSQAVEPEINFPTADSTPPPPPVTPEPELSLSSPPAEASPNTPLAPLTHHQNGSNQSLPEDITTAQPVTNTAPPEAELPPEPILSSPPETETVEAIDFSEIIARSNVELKRLSWTSEQGRNYLLQTYGKRSRQLLSDEQLLEFLAYLENLPTPE